MELKYTKRIAIIFLISMITVTLFSKSLNYWLSPKVSIEKPKSGNIKEEKFINEFYPIYKDEEFLYFNSSVVEKFYIESFIRQGQIVKKEDVLFRLRIPNYTDLKDNYNRTMKQTIEEKDYLENQKDLSTQKSQMEIMTINNKIEYIELQIQDIQNGNTIELKEILHNLSKKELVQKATVEKIAINKELLNNDIISLSEYNLEVNNLKEIENEINILKENYIYKKDNDIKELLNTKKELIVRLKDIEYNNNLDKTLKDYDLKKLLEGEIKQQKSIEELASLDENIEIKSPVDGIITTIGDFENTYYLEGELLCKIKSILDYPLYKISLESYDIENWINNSEIYMCFGDKNIECEIVDIINQNNDHVEVVIKLLELIEIEDYIKQVTIKLKKSSDFYPIIIPSSALIDGEYVYTIEEKDYRLWGSRYFIVKSSVEIGDYNANEIGIKSGLTLESQVITSWDRELIEGKKVVIRVP